MLRRSVKTTGKARVFTKGNLQNELDDSSLDFTKSLNNTESNTYDQTNARASGDFDFSDFFKAFKEGILLKDIKEVWKIKITTIRSISLILCISPTFAL